MSLLNVPRSDIHSPFRALNNMLNRASGDEAGRALPAGAVLWGVVRRDGMSDLDDPSAHAGLAQHAYPVDADEQAICGYRPPRRRTQFSSGARVELAAPSSVYNPACERCVAAIGASPDAEAGAITLEAKAVDAAPTATLMHANDQDLSTDTLAEADTSGHEMPSALPEAVAATVELPTVRHGGFATIEPGDHSLTLRSRDLRAGAAIVASLEGAPRGLRVVSVAVHGRGLASVVLNRKVERPVQVAWFVVSPAASGSRLARSRAA